MKIFFKETEKCRPRKCPLLFKLSVCIKKAKIISKIWISKKQNDRSFNEPPNLNLNIVRFVVWQWCSKKEKSWFQNLSKEILPGSLTQLDPSGEWYTITVFLLLRSLFHFFTFSLFHFFLVVVVVVPVEAT